MVKYLCVAEKPSISKSITQILSGGQFNTRNSRRPQWIKNYDFSYRLPPSAAWIDFTVTAVAGHLMVSDFEKHLKGWQSCDPFTLFDAQINHYVNPDPDQKGIEANLIAEAKKATHLMIWTDCDREGEHIGSEVAQVCRKANPRIIVKRARFSAIIANQINHACRNPVDLDMRQANAVAARMDLDLRVGAVLTRSQTLGLQARFGSLAEKVISYGPCQFPTLGFVVDQYERVQAFVPEPFWSIHVALQREETLTSFTWRRGRLFDKDVVEVLFSLCEDDPEATVVSQQTKPTQKWKPLPLTTVELQKTGSRLLRMTPKQILDVSDSLYQKGYLSYPRTETDQFDKDFDFDEMIQKHHGDAAWGTFATNLSNGGFERPRNGKKNDKAHPPIHPTAHVNSLTGDDKKVYDLVTRRFLACCSKNARGMETIVEIDIAGESFSAKGLIVQQRNYLDVYIYDKWNGNLLPDFQVGEKFIPDVCEIKEGVTSSPNYLTEADLVSLMDKNGIGTDATIAEHISKIIEREYVFKQRKGNSEYLLPSTLGTGLVKGYDAIGFDKSLSKPHLRRLTETRMTQVCDGIKSKQEVIDETLDEYRDMFLKTRNEFQTLINAVGRYIEGDGADSDSDDDDAGGGGPNSGGGAPRGGRGGARGAARGARGAARGAGRGGAAPRGGGGGRGGRGGGAAAPKRRKKDDSDEEDDYPDAGGGAAIAIPNCQCDEPAAERTVMKESTNKGRKFFGCSKGMDDGCGFFDWADAGGGGGGQVVPQKRAGAQQQPRNRAPPPPRQDGDESDKRRCLCDLTAVERTTIKEGPNQGRVFFACPNVSRSAQCKFFEWADDDAADNRPAPRAGGSGGGGGGGGGTSGTCFICSEEGHWSRDCPQKNAGGESGGSGSRAGGGGGGGGQSGECFICHQEGHWSSACPEKGAGGGGGGGSGSAGCGSNYSCFKCGEQGHFSNACTNDGGGGGYGAPARGRGRGRARARGKRGRGG